MFFAVFWSKPQSYYWAKLLKVFANDSEEEANEVEMQFLKGVENTSDPTQIRWDWPTKDDIGIVIAKLCRTRSPKCIRSTPTKILHTVS